MGNNSWARTTDELSTTLEDWPTTYPNSQLGRSHRSIVHGGESGFNSCIEATKTSLTGNLKSLPPSTFTNVSFVARSSPRNESCRQCGPSRGLALAPGQMTGFNRNYFFNDAPRNGAHNILHESRRVFASGSAGGFHKPENKSNTLNVNIG